MNLISLPETKNYLRVDHCEDDKLILTLIDFQRDLYCMECDLRLYLRYSQCDLVGCIFHLEQHQRTHFRCSECHEPY